MTPQFEKQTWNLTQALPIKGLSQKDWQKVSNYTVKMKGEMGYNNEPRLKDKNNTWNDIKTLKKLKRNEYIIEENKKIQKENQGTTKNATSKQ